MPPTSDALLRTVVDSQLPSGDSIKVPLNCPECNEIGLVDWKSLRNGIGCPKCGCQFVIDRSGRVLSQADLPHARFSCPRCKKSGSIPLIIASRGTRCPDCHLPLVLGTDQRLRAVSEEEELRRTIDKSAVEPALVARLLARLKRNDGSVRTSAAAFCVAILMLGLTFIGIAIRSYFDTSPETMAREFALACLSGDSEAPLAHLEDNAVQRASFDRWRVRYFPSILDAHPLINPKNTLMQSWRIAEIARPILPHELYVART
jgi:hypothetical protein